MTMEELREKNLATIHAFLECADESRKETRAPLFTPDAIKEMAIPQTGEIQSKSAFEWLEESVRAVPKWKFYENQIFQCDDPNLFLVKSIGRGNEDLEGTGELTVYINYYINEFLMEDGKIKRFRETFNPCERLHR